jgi:hypothetical protein
MKNAKADRSQSTTAPLPTEGDNVSAASTGPADARPLAAYRLGHHSHALRMWQQFFWEETGQKDTDTGARVAVQEMKEALDALSGEVRPEVLEELLGLLREADAVTARMTDLLRTPGEFGHGPAPGFSNWQTLRLAADRALEEGSPLRRWFCLGAALGDYELHCHVHKDPLHVPDLRPVLEAARALDGQQVALVPVLRALLHSSGGTNTLQPRVILEEALVPLCQGTGVEAHEPISWLKDVGPLGDTAAMGVLLGKLDDGIQSALAQIRDAARPLAKAVREQEKPRWDKKKGKLLLGDLPIRRVAGHAKNVRLVLDAFEEVGWPDRLDDPIPGRPGKLNSQRLSDTIKSLNTGLKHIRFHTDGTGEGICWERR